MNATTREFKFRADAYGPRATDRTIRIVAWTTVGILLCAAAFGIVSVRFTSPEMKTVLAWGVIVFTIVTIFAGQFWAIKLGTRNAQRNVVIVMTDHTISRKRSGWPDVVINFSEIRGLYESRDWLRVQPSSHNRYIAIPKEIEKFSEIRNELAKYAQIEMEARSHVAPLIPLGASVLCWLIIFLADERWMRISAAAAAFSLMMFESYRLIKGMRRRKRSGRIAAILIVALGWATAIVVAYLRIANPSP